MTTAVDVHAAPVPCRTGLRHEKHDTGWTTYDTCSTAEVAVSGECLDGGGTVTFVVSAAVMHDYNRNGIDSCSVVTVNVVGRDIDVQVDDAVRLGQALIDAAEAVRL